MQATFSTAEKRRQALLRARNELVSFLRALLLSSAAEMGEPTKETEEEMHGRATRMRAQVLRTLATLVKHFPTALDQSSRPSSTLMASSGLAEEACRRGESDPDALEATARKMNESLKELWMSKTFWKHPLEQHPDVSVWTAWCGLVASLAVHQPCCLAPAADVLAPIVFAALRDAPQGCDEDAWTAVLCFTSVCPVVLQDVEVAKKLARDAASQMAAGRVTVSRLFSLGLRLLKHAPEGWGAAQLQALWLLALLSGFKKKCATAQFAGAEQCAQGLVEVLVLVLKRSAGRRSEAQAAAEPLLKELVEHAHSEAFGRGLWNGTVPSNSILFLFF